MPSQISTRQNKKGFLFYMYIDYLKHGCYGYFEFILPNLNLICQKLEFNQKETRIFWRRTERNITIKMKFKDRASRFLFKKGFSELK